MFAVIGIATVFGAVISGYMIEHGNLSVLFQPSEFIIIFGAAIGSFLIASPGNVLKLVMKNIGSIFKPGSVDQKMSIELLMVLNLLFRKARREGLLALESEVDNPKVSECFKPFKRVLAKPRLVNFICDNFKMLIATGMEPHELDHMMELDIEAEQSEAEIPGTMISKLADSLPGLGIVAAVLGVVLTMGKINQPPEVLGHSIGAALVGTFLGVLACYGFVGPVATNLERRVREELALFTVIKTAIVSSVGGALPQAALEFGRRAIPGDARPTLIELETAVKKWSSKE